MRCSGETLERRFDLGQRPGQVFGLAQGFHQLGGPAHRVLLVAVQHLPERLRGGRVIFRLAVKNAQLLQEDRPIGFVAWAVLAGIGLSRPVQQLPDHLDGLFHLAPGFVQQRQVEGGLQACRHQRLGLF